MSTLPPLITSEFLELNKNKTPGEEEWMPIVKVKFLLSSGEHLLDIDPYFPSAQCEADGNPIGSPCTGIDSGNGEWTFTWNEPLYQDPHHVTVTAYLRQQYDCKGDL